MARAATTTDVFNAIAEPRRREILDLLSDGRERAVGDVVAHLGLAQPTVSKHLAVLRAVGLVCVTTWGQHRLYRLNAAALRPVRDWMQGYERYWTHQIDRIKESAEQKAAARDAAPRDAAPRDAAPRDAAGRAAARHDPIPHPTR